VERAVAHAGLSGISACYPESNGKIELPAELIDEKFAQGLKAQFLLEILKTIYDPEKIRVSFKKHL